MTRLALLVVAGMAVLLAVVAVIPEPYDNWFLVAVMIGSVGANAISLWRAYRAAGKPVLVHLRRTSYQRHALWSAAFIAVLSVWLILTEPQSLRPAHSTLFWINSGMIMLQLMTGLPRGKVTEAGILVNGTLLRWNTLQDPQWMHGEPATLTYSIQTPRGQPSGRLALHPDDAASVSAAMTRYL